MDKSNNAMTVEEMDHLIAVAKESLDKMESRKTCTWGQAIMALYPDIQTAIEEKGLTRQEIYDQLPQQLRDNISLATFLSYYYAARNAHMKEQEKSDPFPSYNELFFPSGDCSDSDDE